MTPTRPSATVRQASHAALENHSLRRAAFACLIGVGLIGTGLSGALTPSALAAPVDPSAPEAREPSELRRAAKEMSDAASQIVAAPGPRPESTARAALANAMQTAADTLKRYADAIEESEFDVKDATRRAKETALRAGAAAQQAGGRAASALAREGARIKSRSPELTAAIDKAQLWANALASAQSPFWTEQTAGFATCVMLAASDEGAAPKPVLLATLPSISAAEGVASVTGPAGTRPARFVVRLGQKASGETLAATKRAVLQATTSHIVSSGAVGAVWIMEETDPC